MTMALLFVAADPWAWLVLDDGAVSARGEGTPPEGVPVTLVVPADRVSWHDHDMTELSFAQAQVAARLAAAESSLGDVADRHVAVLARQDGYLVTSAGWMRALLADLRLLGIDPVCALPSPALLPPPDAGFVRATFPGETVLRSRGAGLRDEDGLAALVVGDAEVATLAGDDLVAAIAASAAAPPVNLLQGELAPRLKWSAEQGYWRRMARYAAAAALLSLAIPVAKLVKLELSNRALEAQAAEIAASGLGEVEAGPDTMQRLVRRLEGRRGGGLGYARTEAAVVRAVEQQPNAELAMLAFDRDGSLRATVRGVSQADLDIVRAAIVGAGFTVSMSATTAEQGRQRADFQVRPQ